MKNIILILFLFVPAFLLAQYPYPATGNKQRLGHQTTGDGLVFRGSGAPAYTPSSRVDPYIFLDTVANRYYHYSSGAWRDLSDEKYIHFQDANFLASPVKDSLTTYDRLFVAMEITSGGASDRGVQLPVTALDTSYAGRVVRVSAIDSSGTYDVFVSSSSPDGLLVDGALITTYYLEAEETTEFQLYVFNDTYQWRLVHTNDIEPLPSDNVTGSGTSGTLTKWTGTNTIGDAAITENATRLSASLPFRLANIATISLPGAPLTGDQLFNTTTGHEWVYGTSSWLQGTFPTGTSGQTLRYDGSSWVASPLIFNTGTAVGIGTTSPSNTLHVENLGSAQLRLSYNSTNYVTYQANSGGNLIVSPTGGNIGINTSPSNTFHIQPLSGQASFRVNSYGNPTDDGGEYIFARAKGTPSSPTALSLTTDRIFRLQGQGRDASTFRTGADISMFVDNTVSSGNVPMRITFGTVPVGGGATPVERMRIESDGQIRIGSGTTASYQLQITGTDAVSTPYGTTAQRPTIVASTSPIRFNSDSTAYEGGYGVGDWRLFASRNWVRTNFAPIASGYTGFTPAADSGSGSNVASGGTLTFTGGYGINTSVSGTTVTPEVDTGQIATQYDLTQLADLNGLFSASNNNDTAALERVLVDKESSLSFVSKLDGVFQGDGGDSTMLVVNFPIDSLDLPTDGLLGFNTLSRFSGSIAYMDDYDDSGNIFVALNGTQSTNGFFPGALLYTLNYDTDGNYQNYGYVYSVDGRTLMYGSDQVFLNSPRVILSASGSAGAVQFNSYGAGNKSADDLSVTRSGFVLAPGATTGKIYETGGILFTQTAIDTVNNTSSEASLINTGKGSVTLAANYLEAGRTIVCRGSGWWSNSSVTPSLQFRQYIGATEVGDTGAGSVPDLSGGVEFWNYEVDMTCQEAGVSGKVMTQGAWSWQYSNFTDGRKFVFGNTTTSTINTTTAQTLDFTVQMSSADANAYVVMTNFYCEAKN